MQTSTGTEEMRQMRSDLDSMHSQLSDLAQANHAELQVFVNRLKNWISFTPNSTLTDMAHQIHNHLEEQQQSIAETRDAFTQTAHRVGNHHVSIQTYHVTVETRQTQVDAVQTTAQGCQTGNFEQLWSEVRSTVCSKFTKTNLSASLGRGEEPTRYGRRRRPTSRLHR